MTTELKVKGMNCGACVSHVTKALQGVAGVQSATVDLAVGTAQVEHQSGIEPQALIEAVTEAGFGADLNK